MMKKILFMVPYPLDKAPSQRFRFEHFLKFMEQSNLKWDFQSFVLAKSWNNLYQKQQNWVKLRALVGGFFRRFSILFELKKYNSIFIHRELTPLGPPIFEWIIAKVLKKKIIYDFDDAIWLPDQNRESRLWKWLKWRSKVALICKWSWKVSVGNDYLAEYARQFNENVVVIPTIVDTEVHRALTPLSPSKRDKVCIGWTGSHSTLQYLDQLLPALEELEKQIDFEFLVIADQNPELPLINFRFVKWVKNTEVEDLAQMDIGVMPLPNDEWSKGKCGFKLIQYLSLGIPAIASPVGVNSHIIQQEKTGLLAASKEEWVEYLKQLIQNHSLRAEMGKKGQKLIIDSYSVKSQKEHFLSLFEA